MNRLWKRFRWYLAAIVLLVAVLFALGFLKHLAHLKGVNWYSAAQVRKGMTYQQVCDLVGIPSEQRHQGDWGESEFRAECWADNQRVTEWSSINARPGELTVWVNRDGTIEDWQYIRHEDSLSVDQWQIWLRWLGL